MLSIFSTPVLIRHLWQLKAVVFLHRCLICAVLLMTLNIVMQWPALKTCYATRSNPICVMSTKVAKASNLIRYLWVGGVDFQCKTCFRVRSLPLIIRHLQQLSQCKITIHFISVNAPLRELIFALFDTSLTYFFDKFSQKLFCLKKNLFTFRN